MDFIVPLLPGNAGSVDDRVVLGDLGNDELAHFRGRAQKGLHAEGFEFTLDCPNNRYVNDEEVCQAVVGMWAKLGVKAKLNAMPFGPFAQKFQNWDSSAYLLGWGVATYDAQYTLQSLVRTRTKGADGNFNFSGVSNARLDELVDAMGVETNKAKRDAMVSQMFDPFLRRKDLDYAKSLITDQFPRG